MKIYCLSLLAIIGLFLSGQKEHAVRYRLPQTDSILAKKKSNKEAIDQYISKYTKSVIILVKVPGKENLVPVKNENWPDEVEYTYNIYKNPAGKIIFIAQIPFSESGDWDIEYKHYFDEQGLTFAFSKEESVFDENVKGGVVREILLNYYDETFKNIRQINRLTDKDYKAIKKRKNGYDFREYKYSIFKNLSSCLNGYWIRHLN
ncbi:hypothetical protein [Mucilaginibacter sp.]|uniref:hypothetical protein n=1 Tax=Mucilaginibacter sp. TaxID=1882438 RepID=UPI00374D16ED